MGKGRNLHFLIWYKRQFGFDGFKCCQPATRTKINWQILEIQDIPNFCREISTFVAGCFWLIFFSSFFFFFFLFFFLTCWSTCATSYSKMYVMYFYLFSSRSTLKDREAVRISLCVHLHHTLIISNPFVGVVETIQIAMVYFFFRRLM